jgi:AcrR family transcriptional regulator
MAKSSRRVGAETSKTRALILENAERLMLEQGYAAVTYRHVADASGVTAPLVQYYFPSIDELFIALLTQHAEPNLERLTAALQEDDPLRVIWDYSTDETSAALMMEFMALGNHRKAIRSEIAEVSARSRKVQLEALSRLDVSSIFADQEIPPAALLFLLAGIPKIMLLESTLGVFTGHAEILNAVERYLDTVEPKARRRSATKVSKKSSATYRSAKQNTESAKLSKGGGVRSRGAAAKASRRGITPRGRS